MRSLGPATPAPPADALRAGLENIISELRLALRRHSGTALADALLWAADGYDALSRGACDSALNTTLFRSESERSEYDWIAEQYGRLSALGRQVVEKLGDDPLLPRDKRAGAIAYAMLLSGHDAKWRQISGHDTGPPLANRHHALLARALAVGVSDVIVPVCIEGETIDTTAESLYARALLLDRLASGNLSARQIEILDNWLAAWMPALMISRQALDDEPCLYTDLDEAQGLRVPPVSGDPGNPSPGGRRLYLPVAPLLRQLDRAVEYFHQGLIFPGFGLGMTFRIEEHLGVIDYLSREFALLKAGATQKCTRFPVQSEIDVDVYFGMNDVVGRAINANALQRVALLAEGARDRLRETRNVSRGFVETSEFAAFDPSRKVLPVRDVSESGLGLSVLAAETEHIHVGDLAAIRLDAGVPVLLGTVSRKAMLPGGTRHVVGINFISKRAQPLTLEFPADGETVRPAASAIFVPGADESGRGDSILASESVYRTDTVFRVKVAGTFFGVRLGRIKKQGRGWKMAAFDVTACAD